MCKRVGSGIESQKRKYVKTDGKCKKLYIRGIQDGKPQEVYDNYMGDT